MPASARQGDMCSGSARCAPSPIIGGSVNVHTNARPAARVGDVLACGAIIIAGSATVFNNSRPRARQGDPISCGALVICGSPNVFAGD